MGFYHLPTNKYPNWVWKTKFGEGFFMVDYREKLQTEYTSHRQDD